MKISEPLLEPLVRRLRFDQALRYLPKKRSLSVLDLGCGPDIPFYQYLLAHGFNVKGYMGVDPLVTPRSIDESVHIIKAKFEQIPVKYRQKTDLVVAFAVLEHVDNPRSMMTMARNCLLPGGTIIFTTPTYIAKYGLEFLAYKLKLISRREIEEHKQYFDRRKLLALAAQIFPGAVVTHRYFELGINNLLVITTKK